LGFYRFLLARARHTLKLANKEHPLPDARAKHGINYFADLRMTFRQNLFLKDKFRNKLGVGLG
jgi:hypothetical protein